MGTASEFFFQPPGPESARLTICSARIRFATPGGGLNGIRSLVNPIAFGDPDHYSIRFTGPEDNGGVHINSTIPSHAFYLAIEGGRNRVSGSTVQGVGAANREQIEKVLLSRVRLPASRIGQLLHCACGDDSGGSGSLRGKQRGCDRPSRKPGPLLASIEEDAHEVACPAVRDPDVCLLHRRRGSDPAACASPRAAATSGDSERVFFSAGVLFQVNSNDFTDTATIRRNAENGRLETAYDVSGGLAFDVSGSYLVWKNLAVGVGLTLFSASTTTSDRRAGAASVLLQSAAHGDGRVRR